MIDGRTRLAEMLGHVSLAAVAAMILSTVTFFILVVCLSDGRSEETNGSEIAPRRDA
jgi:hypothetical protein